MQVSFCLLLQSGWMSQGGLAAWHDKVALYVSQFQLPEYLLVLGNRPLVHIFDIDEVRMMIQLLH
jgi:hypothetical protein